MERKHLHFIYKVSIYPTSEKGERLLRRKKGTKGPSSLSWYYTDPNETEEEHVKIVEQRIPVAMANMGVPGYKTEDGSETFMLNLTGDGYQRPIYRKDWGYTLERIDYPIKETQSVKNIPAF